MTTLTKAVKLKLKKSVLITVSFELSMKEINEFPKMKLKKQWRITVLNYNLLVLEREGMVELPEDGYELTSNGKCIFTS